LAFLTVRDRPYASGSWRGMEW